MRKEFLILGLAVFSFKAQAACIEAPSCTEMGYTRTAFECKKGSVKCPWNTSLVYCKEKTSSLRCEIGWIYYNDNTCSAEVFSGKTALGVVAYVNPDGFGGQAVALSYIGSSTYSWAVLDYNIYKEEYDIPTLQNYSDATIDFNSCSNTAQILADTQTTYPAAELVNNYAPTPETKGKWCLPAAGIITNWYRNAASINATMNKIGGTSVSSSQQMLWTSTEYSFNTAWSVHQSSSNALLVKDNKVVTNLVRPVLEF